MRRNFVLILFLVFFIRTISGASDTVAIDSIVQGHDNIEIPNSDNNSIKVEYVDKTGKDCWDIFINILQIIIGIIVPISSVLLAYYMNKQNLESTERQRQMELDKQLKQSEKEFSQQKELDLKNQKIQRQAEIITLLNKLYKECLLNQLPDKKELIDASNQIVAAYPYLGKELYEYATKYFAEIEKASDEERQLTQTQIGKINEYLSKYMSKYKETIET